MDKQTLVRDMKKEIGNFPCQSEIAHYLGKSRDYVARIMADTAYISEGRKKQYFAGDVADVIMAQRKA